MRVLHGGAINGMRVPVARVLRRLQHSVGTRSKGRILPTRAGRGCRGRAGSRLPQPQQQPGGRPGLAAAAPASPPAASRRLTACPGREPPPAPAHGTVASLLSNTLGMLVHNMK
eukprot:SAG25_NODE_1006_length_4335_cov_4.453494_7_plen_114_part_00